MQLCSPQSAWRQRVRPKPGANGYTRWLRRANREDTVQPNNEPERGKSSRPRGQLTR
jgi:hypothetical protein